ncbi:MAG: hypothetical protein CMJ84_18170 [Planctomycetes bacterium]|jgi:hypothetical protein|nr:hypothetical protein [Planctomycetota bacterium]MDP6410543.1 hypothetical protein [Planctomycetota bacterium]
MFSPALLLLPALGTPVPLPQDFSPRFATPKHAPCFDFVPDAGVRIANVAVPAPGVDPVTGEVFVYCSNGPNHYVATSMNGLDFSPPTIAIDHENDPRCTLMPFPDANGQPWWRLYRYQLTTGTFISSSSTDGIRYFPEAGTRYNPPASDGAIGVFDLFDDSLGDLHLFYIGDMGGSTHGVRRAVSLDGGDTFEFVADNVLGDMGTGNGNQYVDPKFTRLDDGRLRLFTMNQGGHPPNPGSVWTGEIFSFTSSDDGRTFPQDPGVRLSCPDFTEFAVWSLNDPWVVQLADGRYRMYVAGLISDGSGGYTASILSATAL